jgi:steroid 5-alpha reductase family enzyme
VSWGPLLVNLAVTAGLVAVLMLATFLYAMRTRVHAIMDTVWPRCSCSPAVWGLRLGAHIYTRNRGQGEDKRYASLLRRRRVEGAIRYPVPLPVPDRRQARLGG